MSRAAAAGDLIRAARQIAAAALAAVDPSRLVAAELGRRRAGVGFCGAFALGKAAAALARGAEPFLAPGLPRLLVRPHSAPSLGFPEWEEISGGHPFPDAASVAAGERLVAWLEGLLGPAAPGRAPAPREGASSRAPFGGSQGSTAEASSSALPPPWSEAGLRTQRSSLPLPAGPGSAGAPLLALISGGGSACLEVPVEGVGLAELVTVQRALMGRGVPIAGLNAVRAHLSRIKGGGALRVWPGRVLALVLSDVPGDDPAVVASGPFAADASTFGDALAALGDAAPAAVHSFLASGTAGGILETVKPGDPALARLELVRIGGIGSAVEAAAAEARRLGFSVTTGELAGEAAAAGRGLVERGRRLPDGAAGAALVLGGETVVRLGPESGCGGRNQELALAAAGALAGGGGEVVLALATDGEDGVTGAAGAVVDGAAWGAMARAGLEPFAALLRHDSHAALSAVPGALVVTGPTGTNVADLAIYLRAR